MRPLTGVAPVLSNGLTENPTYAKYRVSVSGGPAVFRVSTFGANVYDPFAPICTLDRTSAFAMQPSPPHSSQQIKIAGEVITVLYRCSAILAELAAKFGIVR